MHAKLAGHLPLQEMISQVIDGAGVKLAAAKAAGKPAAPSREQEKTASAPGIDFLDPDHIEKLASALSYVGDSFVKEADGVDNGGEAHQGGTQLAVMGPVSGTQPYKKDGSKKHQVPMHTGLQSSSDSAGGTQVPNDHAKAPGGPAYPAKGVLKTASESVLDRIQKVKEATAAGHAVEFAFNHPHLATSAAGAGLGAAAGAASAEKGKRLQGAGKGALIGGAGGAALSHAAKAVGGKGAKDIMSNKHTVAKHTQKRFDDVSSKAMEDYSKMPVKEGSADSVGYILSKIAEATQGGMTLDSPAGVGPKPPSDSTGGNDARKAIESNSAVVAMKKVDGKKPQKRMLSEVLTEPALTSSTDSKVQENLRNATKGGVKIAAAAFLQKIASDPEDPRHEKLKEAIEKKKAERKEASSGEAPAKPTDNPFASAE